LVSFIFTIILSIFLCLFVCLLCIKSLKSICYVHQNNCMCVLYNTVHSWYGIMHSR
jgi:hypothetical protein